MNFSRIIIRNVIIQNTFLPHYSFYTKINPDGIIIVDKFKLKSWEHIWNKNCDPKVTTIAE